MWYNVYRATQFYCISNDTYNSQIGFNFRYKADLDRYEELNAEDREEWDAIIEEARQAGCTEEEIKREFGNYERVNNEFDEMAMWVSI